MSYPAAAPRLLQPLPAGLSHSDRRRARRRAVTALASAHGGVVCTRHLHALGVTPSEVRAEVAAGRWARWGRRTLAVALVHRDATRCQGWRAVWETGPEALLDGAAALIAHGLIGFTTDRIDVSLPLSAHRPPPTPGIVAKRRVDLSRAPGGGLPRVRAALAAVRAAQMAVSDRQAALLLVMGVQQRVVGRKDLGAVWAATSRSPRRRLIDDVVRLACGGTESLGELDFAAACRRWGLPEPTRQAVRRGPKGRLYLDVHWERHRLTVEIDGLHHYAGLAPVDDALRQNELALQGDRVLRIPAVALAVDEAPFMRQVARALGVTPRR